jgi:hypothetical protein
MQYLKYGFILSMLLLLNACYYDNKDALFEFVQPVECNTSTATYSLDIKPIMDNHCIRCHRNGRKDGNVNLEGYNNVKNYANDGSLFGTTNHEAGYTAMPDNGVKIPACEIEILRLWISEGAMNN